MLKKWLLFIIQNWQLVSLYKFIENTFTPNLLPYLWDAQVKDWNNLIVLFREYGYISNIDKQMYNLYLKNIKKYLYKNYKPDTNKKLFQEFNIFEKMVKFWLM